MGVIISKTYNFFEPTGTLLSTELIEAKDPYKLYEVVGILA